MLEAAGLESAQIDLALVRGAQHLATKMAELARQHDALICDAETDDDLRTIAAAIAALPGRMGWATIWADSSAWLGTFPKRRIAGTSFRLMTAIPRSLLWLSAAHVSARASDEAERIWWRRAGCHPSPSLATR
jgi:hypothetical protein